MHVFLCGWSLIVPPIAVYRKVVEMGHLVLRHRIQTMKSKVVATVSFMFFPETQYMELNLLPSIWQTVSSFH